MSSPEKNQNAQERRPPSSSVKKQEGSSRKMAANNTQDTGKRSSWLGLSRSKKKYNFRTQPTYSEPPDEDPLAKPVEDKRDIPTLLERLDTLEHSNVDDIIALQKTVISRLVEENKSLKSQKSYADVLRAENAEIKKELKELKDNRTMQEFLQKDNIKQNGINIDESNSTVVDVLTKEIRDLKAENSRMKIVNEQLKYAKEQLQIALDHQSRQIKENSGTIPQSSQNGLSHVNGHHNPSLPATTSTRGTHSRASSRSSFSSPAVSTCNDEIEELEDENDDSEGEYPAAEGYPSQNSYRGAKDRRSTSIQMVPCICKVSGVLHHCDEILVERVRFNLRSRGLDLKLEVWSKSTMSIGKLCLVFCLNASRLGTDVDNALKGISDEAEVVLIVMHHLPRQQNRMDPQSESIIGKRDNICLVVDMFFFEKEGLYDCEQNDKGLAKIVRLFEMLC
ncbi:uncharacterized protein [Ptychodera flava]|uniref:uncharacterized protein n=1 Tax=Ptychodera flava TaxID=63121 RepID=UPI00396A9651